MGTWSIEKPDPHPLASINGSSGLVTFQPHTEMTSYTIKFTGTTAETKCKETTLFGNIVVLACPSPCTFGVSSTGNKVPNRTTSTTTNVATYTLGTTCGAGSFTFAFVGGSDFLTGLTASGNIIKAAVKEDNPSSSVRYGTYKVTFTPNSGAAPPPCTFTVQQDGIAPPQPVTNCPIADTVSVKVLDKRGGANKTLVEFHTDVDKSGMVAVSIVNWMSDLRVTGLASRNYRVTGTYDANTGTSTRYAEIVVYCDNTKTTEVVRLGMAQLPIN